MGNRKVKMDKGSTYNEGISADNQSVLTIPINKEVLENSYIRFLENTITPALKPYGDLLLQQ